MSETAEGIGGRKWSFQTGTPPASQSLGSVALYLSQGKYKLAMMMPQETEQDAKMLDTEKVELLLVVSPQLWDAANEFTKLNKRGRASDEDAVAYATKVSDAEDRLANMVAKAVGKTDWKDVAQ